MCVVPRLANVTTTPNTRQHASPDSSLCRLSIFQIGPLNLYHLTGHLPQKHRHWRQDGLNIKLLQVSTYYVLASNKHHSNECGDLTIFTGHSYYYSAATKTSTYTRPVAPASVPFAVGRALGPYPTYAPPHGSHGGGFLPQKYPNQQQFPQFGYGQSRGRGGTGRGGRFDNQNPRQQKRQERLDRPKSKY